MAQNNDPTWISFGDIDVKDGMTVGVYDEPVGEEDEGIGHLEQTGQVFLDRNRATPSYQTVIKGQHLILDTAGKVVEAEAGAIAVDDTLRILSWDIPQTYSVKTDQTRAGGGFATLTESTLRDQFACCVLNAMIVENPALKDADDAGMYSASTVAYRFAEAMMRSAADYRANEAPSSPEQQEVGSDTVISGSVKIENTVTTEGGVSTKNPLIVNGSGTNGELTVKGNSTYHPDNNPSNDIAGVLNVNVVNAGKLKSSDVDVLSTESDIASVLVFKLNANNPYKVTPFTLTKAMYEYLDPRYGLKMTPLNTPPSTYAAGNYYNIQTENALTALSITLPALSVTEGKPVKIFIVRATITGTLTVTFSGDLMWRGSKQTSLNGEYEIDFIDNGSCWTVGVTEIVSN